MNLRQTVEVAALASLNASAIIERAKPPSTQSLHAYWKLSRIRLKCWFACLRALSASEQRSSPFSPRVVGQQVVLSRSILVAEMLTRIWSSVLIARDRTNSENLCGAVVQDVFAGQLEARKAVLQLLADQERFPALEAAGLIRLRHRVENWTDALLGPFVRDFGVSEFAFHAERARESFGAASPLAQGNQGAAMTQLTLLGVSRLVPGGSGRLEESSESALDRAIARVVLNMVSEEHSGTEQTPVTLMPTTGTAAVECTEKSSQRAASHSFRLTDLLRRRAEENRGPSGPAH